MHNIQPSTLITRSSDLLATVVDGETVLMHVENGQYYGLAKSAHTIWILLESPMRFQELCQTLQARYNGPLEVITADTQHFIREMADEALVGLS
jgi:hypothetical protein